MSFGLPPCFDNAAVNVAESGVTSKGVPRTEDILGKLQLTGIGILNFFRVRAHVEV